MGLRLSTNARLALSTFLHPLILFTRDFCAPVPNFVFRPASWIPVLADNLAKAILPPSLWVMRYRICAYMSTRITAALAEIGVADALVAGPKTAAVLAKELKCEERQLFRLLRGAIQAGLFEEAGKAVPASSTTTLFRNNKQSAVLRTDHPNSVRHMAIHQGEEMERAWAQLAWGVKTGGRMFERAHGGEELFDYLKARPATETIFSRAMAEVNGLSAKAVIADYYATRSFKRIVDVGGAHGAFLAAILEGLPGKSTQGLLFDQPQVADRAAALWKAKGSEYGPLLPRVAFAGGSFFEAASLPKLRDGDVLNMRLILHDWSDEDSVAILSAIRKAIGSARVTVALVEMCVPSGTSDPVFQRGIMDLHMMCALQAKERTAEDWASLVGSAGYKLKGIIPTRGLFSVMELTAA